MIQYIYNSYIQIVFSFRLLITSQSSDQNTNTHVKISIAKESERNISLTLEWAIKFYLHFCLIIIHKNIYEQQHIVYELEKRGILGI